MSSVCVEHPSNTPTTIDPQNGDDDRAVQIHVMIPNGWIVRIPYRPVCVSLWLDLVLVGWYMHMIYLHFTYTHKIDVVRSLFCLAVRKYIILVGWPPWRIKKLNRALPSTALYPTIPTIGQTAPPASLLQQPNWQLNPILAMFASHISATTQTPHLTPSLTPYLTPHLAPYVTSLSNSLPWFSQKIRNEASLDGTNLGQGFDQRVVLIAVHGSWGVDGSTNWVNHG